MVRLIDASPAGRIVYLRNCRNRTEYATYMPQEHACTMMFTIFLISISDFSNHRRKAVYLNKIDSLENRKKNSEQLCKTVGHL
jgi:hypothetical protein